MKALSRVLAALLVAAVSSPSLAMAQPKPAAPAAPKAPNGAKPTAPSAPSTPAPPPAAAPPAAPAAAAPANVDAVRARMEKGQGFFVAKQYAEALSEFESGYAEFKFSAFLYNAAVAADKARDRQRAIARYNEFLAAVPDAPDAAEIRARIAVLERELSAPPETEQAPAEAQREEMRSLVLIESSPAGAPVSIYERIVATAATFDASKPVNPGWRKVAKGLRTPADVSLKVGSYQVVVEAFADYNLSDSRINLEPGTLFKFRANLSQGEFLGSLEVKTPAKNALVWIDDPPPHKNAGETPSTRKVSPGERQIWVEAPGYGTFTKKVNVLQGKTTTVDADLVRVEYGYLVVEGNAYEVTVEIDGELKGVYREGKGPIKIKLPGGRHLVEVDADGRKAWEGELEIPRGQELPVTAQLEETSGKGLALLTSLLGLGAIGGGIGMISFADTREKQGDVDQANAFRPVGTAVIVGGGVITGLSIFFWAYDPSDDSTLGKEPIRELSGHEALLPSQKMAPAAKPEAVKSSSVGSDTRRGVGFIPAATPDFAGALVHGRF